MARIKTGNKKELLDILKSAYPEPLEFGYILDNVPGEYVDYLELGNKLEQMVTDGKIEKTVYEGGTGGSYYFEVWYKYIPKKRGRPTKRGL